VDLEPGLFLGFPLRSRDRMFSGITESAGGVPVVLEWVRRPFDQQDLLVLDDETGGAGSRASPVRHTARPARRGRRFLQLVAARVAIHVRQSRVAASF
jgi:hypothetical protein